MSALEPVTVDDLERWITKSEMSDPWEHVSAIADLPTDIAKLKEIIQGVLVHSDWLTRYGVSEVVASRATLPVADRIREILKKDDTPLANQRSPRNRSIGTCRDFALMLTSLLRCHGIPARLRCGFAAYLGDQYEDHWVCEYWDRRALVWRLSDAQIDDMLRGLYQITFDPTDIPRSQFWTAGEAWNECRAGRSDGDRFGHGHTVGLWFIGVNVVRDHFALHGKEVSSWDRWREASPEARVVGEDFAGMFDRIAADPEQSLHDLTPPWLSRRP